MTYQARQQATSEVLVDDDKVRVTRWDFDPGAETRWHRHGMDYVVTTVTPCSFLLEEPGGGVRRVDMAAGLAYRRDEGVEHNVVNAGDKPMSFVEVELKA
ncbi:cupin domain-containing protein [Aminobacter carboxidus]|uniref:Cupin domain-containing protein n=1 Tax=Aminobacter carboxidus TaxID=376165 RepID=A0A8E1WBC7_9HYPH|nr:MULTISPECIES: cupin domain-containing protein [Aminobacter carboxidus group]MBB6464495.1 oxalate decarboxylase/phosphoglucose isomerase-like protein (cupin superfamily) [Aminobacter lissarensis]MBE1206990.1 cupin domain-containing protein [Aminobacter carboxidus]